jgi:polar amino acid transport system substrate-binding protein
MRIGRVVGVAAVCLAVTTATACSSSSADDGKDAGAGFGDCQLTGQPGQYQLQTVKPGVLTIKADLPSVGWWDGDTVDAIKSGYEYCMAANLANMAGLSSVTVKNVSFDQLVAGHTNDFDIALAEISITPDRAKVVDFSKPYFDSNIGVLVQKGSDVTQDNITSKTCAAYSGTTSVPFIQDQLKCKVKIYPDSQTLYQALLSGQVDADFLDTAIVLAEAKATNGKLEVVGQYKTGEKYGAIYPKDSPNEAALNKGIATMLEDGTLEELSKTYLGPAFGGDPSAVPVWTIK